jgi:hypothetical protein
MNLPPITDQEIQNAIAGLQLKLHGKHKQTPTLPLKVLQVQIDFFNSVTIDIHKYIPFPVVVSAEHAPMYDNLSKCYEQIALNAILAMIIAKRHKNIT